MLQKRGTYLVGTLPIVCSPQLQLHTLWNRFQLERKFRSEELPPKLSKVIAEHLFVQLRKHFLTGLIKLKQTEGLVQYKNTLINAMENIIICNQLRTIGIPRDIRAMVQLGKYIKTKICLKHKQRCFY